MKESYWFRRWCKSYLHFTRNRSIESNHKTASPIYRVQRSSADIAWLVLGGNTSSAVRRSWYMPFNKIGKSSPRPAWEEVSPGSSHLKTLWTRWNRLRVLSGELYRTWEKEDVDDECIKLIVPAAKKIELLQYMHDLPSSALLGVDKTFERLKNGFYWPGIKEYVKIYCKSCHHCSAKKPSRKQNKAPMGKIILSGNLLSE